MSNSGRVRNQLAAIITFLSFLIMANAYADILTTVQIDEPQVQSPRQAVLLYSPSKTNQQGYTSVFTRATQPSALADTYSLAPWLVDDLDQFYLASAIGAPTTHTFDDIAESAGANSYGSAGGSFRVEEGLIDLGGGSERYVVEVSAVDSSLDNEPWVDAAFAGQTFTGWILDVGTTDGGSNTLSPGYNFAVQDSGVFVFDSAGTQLGVFDILDTSTSTELSGSSWISLGGDDIAGVDVAGFQIYWDISPAPAEADLDLQLVDASDGVYAPGDSIDILNYTENTGSSTSTAYTITYYASVDTIITVDDISLGAEPVRDPLDPADYDYYLTTASLPANLDNGDYYIGAILTLSDANANNNVNYDAIPISVSDQPEIEISPLTLDFVQQAAGQAAAQTQALAVTRPSKITQGTLTRLTQKLEKGRQVDLIVGLNLSVQLEGKLSSTQVEQQHHSIGAQAQLLASELGGMNAHIRRQFTTVPFMAISADQETLDFLARSPLVANITEDKISKPTMASSNPVIGSPIAWAEGFDGSDWAVAVLDTGVDNTHNWFNTPTNKIVAEACYSSNSPDIVESWCPEGASSSVVADSGLNCDLAINGCDHGTHVAGTVAGNDGVGPNYGVARGADIIAIQVFSKFLTEEDCGAGQAPCTASYSSDQIAAMERVLLLSESMNIAAINMSLGGGQYFDQASCDSDNSAVKTAIDNLRSVGIATVIASGNNGWSNSIGAPGCISTAISVGATNDSDAVASFSNIYPQIHLLAPGVSIDSSIPGDSVGSKQGTSMATPHIAGAWAVMKQVAPTASVSDVLASFVDSATLVDDLRGSGIETAMPRINLDLALDQPRTTFGITNQGPVTLSITSITPETPAAWISTSPQAPFDVLPGELVIVSVEVDYNLAPVGLMQTRLLVESNDLDESPYPGGVFVNVTKAVILEPEFSSTPVAGSTLQLGSIVTGSNSGPFVLSVDNLGTGELTLACEITGADSDQFNLIDCPDTVAAQSNVGVSIDCKPEASGLKQASLDISTNDADEPAVSYPMICIGIDSPSGDFVFSGGFEQTLFSDLLVINVGISQTNLRPEQAFNIDAVARNQGDAESLATDLHYYLSADSIIGNTDTPLGTDPIGVLTTNTNSNQNLETAAPEDSGIWWIGACVDAVSGESNTVNQCSNGLPIVVAPDSIFIVNKVTIPASDDSTTFAFTGNVDSPTLTGGASSIVTEPQGTFTAEETPTNGWALTDISCEGVPAEDITIGDTNVSVVLESGETGTCTFTNTKLGSISLTKSTLGDVGAFTFSGTDVDNDSGVITSPFVLSTNIDDVENNTVMFDGLLPGQYLFEETVPAGWTIDGTMGDIVCNGQNSSAITTGSNNLDITLAAGEHLDCTFTNTRLTAQINLRKQWVSGVVGDTAQLNLNGPSGSDASTSTATEIDVIDTNHVASLVERTGATVTLSENLAGVGSYNTSFDCDGSNNPTYQAGQTSATLLIDHTDTVVTCTFTNAEVSQDSDNDRIPDSAETNTGVFVDSNDTGTDPDNPDTDGDGIKDGDEVLGTLDGLDLPAMGTNPLRKDLLLEYDWFDDSNDCAAHSHRPTAAIIALASAAYSNSPVSNPGSTDGVNMINDYGQGGAFTGGNLIADADGVIAGGVSGSDFKNYKAANFAANRNGYFHYVLLPHRYNTSSGSSGQAEVYGDDLIVSLQCFLSNSNVANTILHEMGHNLNLRHGGNENCNRKPNYNSVMNYKYQFPGIDNNCTPPGDGVLSYSVGDRISLNENSLNENHGTCGDGFPWDWNENTTIENSVSTNINADDSEVGQCGGTLTTLNDYNDWDNILFGGLGDSDGAPLVPLEIITEQPVPVEYRQIND